MSGLCKECVSGVTHEGTPTGKIEKLGDVDVYVAIPPEGVEYAKDKAVLFFCDVFGIQLNNNKLLCDDFARNGLQTYAVDYFDGDPIPENAMSDPNFNREVWFSKHGFDVAKVFADKAVAALKEKGITTFGAVGFCYGAPFVRDYALANTIKAGVFTHPSRLSVPDDLNALLEKSNVPVLFNTCETDPQFPQESQKIADEILGGGKYKPGYERTYWEGCRHGFAVRGDISDPKVKAGKEGAFKATATFFLNNL